MTRTLVALALTFLLGAHAQQIPPPPEIEVLEQPKQRLRKKLILVVDASGSMLSEYDLGVRAAIGIASQSFDGYSVQVIAFGDSVRVKPGGWVDMPDGRESVVAMGWLTMQRPAHTAEGTRADLAVAKAFELDKANEATVILITDGQFVGRPPEIPKGKSFAALLVGREGDAKWAELLEYCSAGAFRLKRNEPEEGDE